MKRVLGLVMLAALLTLPAVAAAAEEDLCLRVDPGLASLADAETVTLGFERGWIEILEVVPCGELAEPDAGEVVSPAEAETDALHDLSGVLTLKDRSANWRKGKACFGRGGYSDIRGGMQLRVRDADGTLLGIGDLDKGQRRSSGVCWFFFSIDGLPESPLYELESGRRGTLAWSLSELEEKDWIVSVTIG